MERHTLERQPSLLLPSGVYSTATVGISLWLLPSHYLVIFLASGCCHMCKSLAVVFFMTLTDLQQDGKE